MEEITIEQAKIQIKTLRTKIFLVRFVSFILTWALLTIFLYAASDGKMFPWIFHFIIVALVSGLLYLLSLTSAYKQWIWNDAQNVWLNPLNKLTEIRKGYVKIASRPEYRFGEMWGLLPVTSKSYFPEYVYERNRVVKDASLRNNQGSSTERLDSGAFIVRPFTRSEIFTILGILTTTIVAMIILDSVFSKR
jgi:hypothetical protein